MAAEQGNVDAQALLGDIYVKGQGTAQDFKKAYIWYGVAAKNGNQNSTHNLPLIETKLTSGQKAKAEKEIEMIWEQTQKNPQS